VPNALLPRLLEQVVKTILWSQTVRSTTLISVAC